MAKGSQVQKSVDGSIFEPILHKLYYTTEEGSAFGGKKALYKAAKKQYPNITLQIVDDFLHRQKVYVDHENLTRKFDRRITPVSAPPNSCWMSEYRLKLVQIIYNEFYKTLEDPRYAKCIGPDIVSILDRP